MSQITKPPEQPERLPIEALNAMFDAVIAKSNLEEITSCVHNAGKLTTALDKASWDQQFSKLDVPAAVAKLNVLRAQFIPAKTKLDDMLTNRRRRRR
jgi:hypothetical protein